MFKKLLLTAITTSFFLSASTYNPQLSSLTSKNIGFNTATTNTQSALNIAGAGTDTNGKPKTYATLINTLEKNPSGEFALALAVIYLNGISVPDSEGKTIKPDKEKAIKFFNKAISLGNYEAASILGSLYLYHPVLSFEKDSVKKAKYYLELALKKGKYEASTPLADLLINKEGNYTEAIRVLEEGAKHGVSTAQLMLAIMYNWGVVDSSGRQILKPEPMTANALLTQACTNPNATEKVKEFCQNPEYIKKEAKKEVK